MLDLLFSRITVVSLAVIGGVFAILASWRQSGGDKSKPYVRWLNILSYVFMAASMILFIGIGFYNVFIAGNGQQ